MITPHRFKRAARHWTASAAVLALTAAGALTGTAAAVAENFPDAMETGTYTEQILAKGGDGQFPNYRIPALANLGDGVVLAAYDGRPTGTDAPGPNSILLRRSTDGGQTWSQQAPIAQGEADAAGGKIGYSDPSFVVDEETGWVHAFYVFSKDTGFWNSDYGNDDADRSVMSAAVAVSKDQGLTWEQRLITDVVKPADVRAAFATSGHGIQLKYGEHAGRLLQQYAGVFRTADGGTETKAYTVYSDDRGLTWQMGTPVGSQMDENKVVELSTGEVMLNSRMHTGGTARYIATSTDGGESYGEVSTDATLVDPRNNAALVRMYPDAPQGSADAKKLLFSNAASAAGRANGTIRYSCDDGRTWPVAKVFQPGSMSYSDMVALGGDNFGLFYEGAGNELRFATFDTDWLAPHCAAVSATDETIDAGSSGSVEITVKNDDDTQLPAGQATVNLDGGATSGTAEVPALAPGASATVEVSVAVPEAAVAGTITGEALITAGDITVRGPVSITVNSDAEAVLDATIAGSRLDDTRDVAEDPYKVGEQVPYRFRVTSLSGVAMDVVPSAGNFAPLLPPGAGNCRWRGLPAWDAYNCDSPRHTVTAEDLLDGFFVPDTTWELRADGYETVVKHVVGSEVDLLGRRPGLELKRSVSVRDVDEDGFDSVGDILESTCVAANTGNVRLASLDAGVTGLAEVLLPGTEDTATVSRTLTDEDLAVGAVTLAETRAEAMNGSLVAEATVPEAAHSLQLAPSKPASAPEAISPSSLWGTKQSDFGMDALYAAGSRITVRNLEPGAWHWLALNGQPVGDWVLARPDGTAEVTLPVSRPGSQTLSVKTSSPQDSSVRLAGWSKVRIG